MFFEFKIFFKSSFTWIKSDKVPRVALSQFNCPFFHLD